MESIFHCWFSFVVFVLRQLVMLWLVEDEEAENSQGGVRQLTQPFRPCHIALAE